MAYRKTERERKRLAGRRAAIVEATRTLIAEGGYGSAQMAAVAKRAGVATGTVYRYFPSKAQLFAAVVDQTSRRELAVLQKHIVAPGAPRQRLADALRTFSERALRSRRLAYALVADPIDPAVDALRLKYRQAMAGVFATLIEQGIAAGEFPTQDVRASAACVVGACVEGLIGPLSPEGGIEAHGEAPHADSIVAFCLAAVSAGHSGR